ncbi:LOW QUALITY PROTEIN: protein Jade-3-like [Ruditapes philippinarum]|uniref:LOW QUALITY PROTEIN: protein Jade-3-like n=1 Tax=Ruditapes philippinarum TaxID=129788 RepID=UPI00295B74B8|nr:LOW QUALITY PROTEIN: protein Jade-3-like [Ruditapes philippinarum]
MPPNKSKRSNEESPERRSKRRRLNDEEEEEEKEKETPLSKGKACSSKKTPHYSGGGGSSHKPAELFRKDLISAMKLPDSEPLAQEDYFLIADTWRQEWERGVQVPVNEIVIRSVDLREVTEKPVATGDFKIPKKFLHAQKDETYQLGQHELTGMSQLSEQVVRYDLDDLDVSWLKQLNVQREEVGEIQIVEWTMERVIEALEAQCHENMETKKKTEEGLGIEYDEDIVCEICQSPDSEDTNEMVFCDGCDICVHQACYGIQTVPEGSWLCRTCALGIKPACILCPKVGGAMKSTRSGTKWSHVSCAIWIPEVTIGCVEKMEPITKISMIPASRWSLICCICKERCGACIQCSVKACKTAFHVTCAISEKLEMKTVLIEDKNTEDVKLKAFCPKHSRKRDRNSSESETDSPRKSVNGTPIKECQMSEEEKATIRAERLHKLEEEFYGLVKVPEIASHLELPEEVVDHIFVYWKLKRRSMFNRPLLTPKTEEADLLEKQQEDSLLARMKMFVHLRQDLERVRNLSYMISRREKIKKQFNSARESVFYAALEVLTDKTLNLSTREVEKIVKNYRDLPEPYGKTLKKVKTTPPENKAAKVVARRPSEIKTEPSESDIFENTVKLKVEEPSEKKVLEGRKSISETPKSRKSRLSSKQESSVKVETDIDLAEKSTKDKKLEENSSKRIKTEKCIDRHAKAAKSNSEKECSDQNNSGIELNDCSGDETLVNISQESSTVENSTIVQSEAESNTDKVIQDSQAVKHNKRGRPKKVKQIKPEEVQTSDDKEESSAKTSCRKVRTRSSLPEIVHEETSLLTSNFEEHEEETETKSELKESKPKVIAEKRDRRYSSVKLSESEKDELIQKFPSARNVSDHVKAELNGYFKNNKLIVSNKLRQKVQNALLGGKRRNRIGKSVVIDHSQKKIDNFFVKSPPPCDPHSPKSTAKNVSRVLNELSPTRDRYEANSIERTAWTGGALKVTDIHIARRSSNTQSKHSPSLSNMEKSVEKKIVTPESRKVRSRYDSGEVISVKEKLFDGETKRITRSSRESTPESTTSSVKSFSSFKHRAENTRLRTRSNTPVSIGKDSDESESENICSESRHLRR